MGPRKSREPNRAVTIVRMAAQICLAVALFVAAAAAPVRMLPARKARADDTSLGRFGETVRPIRDGQVEMVEEDVRVRVTPKDSTVTCRFVFRNTGPATEILMGFPEEATEPGREMGDDVGIHEFKTWVAGLEVPVRREKGGPTTPSSESAKQYPFWWTWPLSLKAGETVEVRNSYRVRNTFVSNGEVRTGYILTTGRAWKGPIGRAKVTFEFAGPRPYEVVHAFPGLYRFEGDNLVWEWTGFEPAADIEVVFSAMYGLLSYSRVMTGEPAPGPATPEQNRRSDLFSKIVSAGSQWDSAQALKYVREFGSLRGLSSEAAQAAALLEARYRFLTGDREYGRSMWQKRVESGNAGAEDYYFLGSLYEKSGDKASLASLYKRLSEVMPPISAPLYGDERAPLWAVRRWLASKVDTPAPGEFSSGKSAPTIEKVTIEHENPSAPVAFVLRPLVKDSDGDLGSVNLRVWTVEGGAEKVAVDISEPSRFVGGREASPGVIFSLPWPFATAYYRVVATDSAGHTADTGAVEWTIDSVKEWQYLDVPSTGGLVRLRYHGDQGRALAAAVSARLAPTIENLDSKLGIRPCNPVIVSFYERALDEPEKAIGEAFPDFPWYVLEAGRAPAPERVADDVLSRILAHNAGHAWYAKPDPELNWLLVGLSEFLAGGAGAPSSAPRAKETWMVASLYAGGKERFAEFIRKTGDDPHGPDKALRDVYSMSFEDLEKRWQSELKGIEMIRVRRIMAAIMVFACAAALVTALVRRCRGAGAQQAQAPGHSG
ncbi:MAG: hypothetical protein HPY55_08095 [Firmicutes bacterium]|nr:hypothetical protein [Bacillota bacterium]